MPATETHDWVCACQRHHQVTLERDRYEGPRDASSTVPGQRIVFRCTSCGFLHAHVRFATTAMRVVSLPPELTIVAE